MSVNSLPAGRGEHSPLRRALSFIAGLGASPSTSEKSLEGAPFNFAEGMPLLDFCRPGFYHWGRVNMPIEFAVRPCVISGEQGSGKSGHLKLLLLSQLQNVAHGYGQRLFLTDFQGEYLPILRRYLRAGAFKYIEPFDLVRGACWDIFADFTCPEDAEEFGRLISPTNQNDREPFFAEACANINAGLFAGVFLARGEHGDLGPEEGGVSYYAQSPEKIREGLNLAPEYNRARIGLYFNTKSPNRDVLSTLGNRMADITAAAVAWRKSRDHFRIADWRAGRFALVLGYSHHHPEATKALNRALVAMVHRTILSDPNCTSPRTYVFLDELPFFGRLDSLHTLLSLGRKKGLAAAISYQDKGLMLEVYGPYLTQAINGLTPQKGFCRTGEPETADSISRHFGESDRVRYTRGLSQSPGQPATTSITEHLDRIRVVPPEAIMNLPVASSAGGNLWAYFISPVLGVSYPCPLPIDMLRRLLPQDDDDDDIDNAPALAPVSPTPPPVRLQRALPLPSPHELSVSDDDELPYWPPTTKAQR